MSVNRDKPYVWVLPEDDDNRKLANGFHQQVAWNRQRQIQVFPIAGGWTKVLDQFNTEHAPELDRFPEGFMILLIDFDNDERRLRDVKDTIPERFAERVFVLGSLDEPKDLRNAGLGSCEAIGRALAKDCAEDTNDTWGHELLRHNAAEIDRLRDRVRPILFQ